MVYYPSTNKEKSVSSVNVHFCLSSGIDYISAPFSFDNEEGAIGFYYNLLVPSLENVDTDFLTVYTEDNEYVQVRASEIESVRMVFVVEAIESVSENKKSVDKVLPWVN